MSDLGGDPNVFFHWMSQGTTTKTYKNHKIHGTGIFFPTYTFLVDFYGKSVGKYTRVPWRVNGYKISYWLVNILGSNNNIL